MSGAILDDHHVVRHGQPRGMPCGRVTIGAFEIDTDNTISVSWTDYFPGTMEQQLDKVREEVQRVRQFRRSHQFAILCAGDIRSIDMGPVHVCVTHRPEYWQYSHSVIHASAEMNDDQWLTVREGLVNAVTKSVPAIAA